jgi:hypothetical protein
MAGLLEALMRRAAPGAYTETPEEQYRKSVMSPDYVPETSNRQPLYGSIRGLLDATPAGFLDAAQAGLNRLPTAGGALVRAVTGRAQGPTDAAMNLLGMQGSGPGYEAGRAASGAAVAGMGLLGNQAGGQLPRGYARDQSGAIVWHGSPHKFDKFDSSKIGTGEGAQAYGHGLYVADNPTVARGYQEKLSDARYLLDGKPVAGNAPPVIVATEIKSRGVDGARAYFRQEAERAATNAAQSGSKKMAAIADNFRVWESMIDDVARQKFAIEQGGHLYKVDLPDEQIAKMLDWDKPWSQQPEAVRKAIDTSALEKFYNTKDLSASQVMFHLNQGRAPADSAEYLRSLGIPGIRYLDGGSRTAGAGSSNYVVFPGNEGLLKILGRE